MIAIPSVYGPSGQRVLEDAEDLLPRFGGDLRVVFRAEWGKEHGFREYELIMMSDGGMSSQASWVMGNADFFQVADLPSGRCVLT